MVKKMFDKKFCDITCLMEISKISFCKILKSANIYSVINIPSYVMLDIIN